MFKKYILFAQGKESSSKSDFIRDGKKVEGPEAFELYTFIKLRQNIEENPNDNHVWESIPVNHNDEKSTLSLYKDNLGNFMVQSHFLDKDEMGRRIAYKFCTQYSTPNKIIQTLQEAAMTIRRHVNPKDIKVIKQLIISHFIIKLITIVVIILILLFIFVTWKIK